MMSDTQNTGPDQPQPLPGKAPPCHQIGAGHSPHDQQRGDALLKVEDCNGNRHRPSSFLPAGHEW